MNSTIRNPTIQLVKRHAQISICGNSAWRRNSQGEPNRYFREFRYKVREYDDVLIIGNAVTAGLRTNQLRFAVVWVVKESYNSSD